MANEEHLAILKRGVEAWHPSPARVGLPPTLDLRTISGSRLAKGKGLSPPEPRLSKLGRSAHVPFHLLQA